MIDLPELPDGSAIRAIRGRKQIRLRWRSGGGFSARLGIYAGILALPFAIAGFAIAESTGHKEVSLAGIGVGLLVAFGLYRWLGGRSFATLILRADSLTFVAPAKPVLPQTMGLPIRGYYLDPEKVDREEWEALRRAHKERRRRTVSRSDITYVESADHEKGGGVVIAKGSRALRLAEELGKVDSEWLSDVLRRWRGEWET